MTKYLQTVIVGQSHYEGAAETLLEIASETRLDLRPEPTNRFDPNAVEVYYGEQKLGYIPKGDAPQVKAIVESDKYLYAEINPIAPGVFVHYREDEEEEQVDEPVQEPEIA